MFSYIYMKVLESQPWRYDRGISWLSLGQSERTKRKLVSDNIRSGIYALEIGVGTGSMAILAAEAGARVLGFDISRAMLQVARKKIDKAGASDSVDLLEMGISGMDRFPDKSFDVVMSTLVFSELSTDEQVYGLRHAYRVLKAGGYLAVADEVKPKNLFKRFLYSTLRIPLLIITFALTQTSTTAVDGLENRISAAGFKIVKTESSALENFLYVVARKDAS